MTEAPTYPTAREVAIAIVTAARIHDDDPVLTVEGATSHRGKWLAIAALQEAFPKTDRAWIASTCGLPLGYRSEQAHAEIKQKRSSGRYGTRWWSEADLNTVKSALAAAIAETDAELRNRMTAAVANPAAVTATPLPGTGGDVDPAPITEIDGASAFAPLFGGLKSDVLDTEESDFFSHLRDARDYPRPGAAPIAPKPVSAAARSIADFQRARIIKTSRGRIIDRRIAGPADMGDPPPGRSALDQRGAP